MMLSLSKAAAFLLLLFSLISVSFAQSSTDSTPSSTTSSSPQTHTVTVGKGTNAYDPNTIEASPGDLIVFEFFPSNHSVIKAAYGYPCVPFEDVVPNGATFFSGHFPLNEVLPNVSFLEADPFETIAVLAHPINYAWTAADVEPHSK